MPMMIHDLLLILRRVLCKGTNDGAKSQKTKGYSAGCVQHRIQRHYLVLMYRPSLVRSLSDVAFSEPAKSIRL